ncbi:MAG: lysophospholipid acyltransferase family protein [Candidatus Omnitrophica bacterium]|nr:lysophospholipid acyltransferase family protein [Candidatus Omnitrophota bacterium]MBU0878467.1 lysophospholipid acyltransferase family protein [Candidatus Omnitrophota bacterium]MBU0896243.1 lysophospholipid acyltransferase family protein [Candidatus Omnitrophota bacterium]MBU1133404.1 lysophospholipid acyltransferase family protein [Candidatus Omnitrophota bacterium]MBU1810671.1 lysophospholipid acyltransferase family protein [Candidatus Omnitrophota bacterium]
MYYLFILARWFSLIFPRSICYLIANFFAHIQFYLSKKDREAVIYNLSPFTKDKKKLKKYAKKVFVNFAYYLVDFFRYAKLDEKFIKKYVRISGIDYLNLAFSMNKGIIILTAHLGNYELAGAIISLMGYPLCAITFPHKDKRLNRFFDYQRKMVGIKIIHTGVTVKKCFSVLKRGGMVGFLGDKDFMGGGIKVKMFSSYVRLPRGIAFFSSRIDAYIVPSFLIRDNKKFYHLIFEEPIICTREEKSTASSEKAIIRKYIPILEKYIKKYPQQWYMFQKYWLPE